MELDLQIILIKDKDPQGSKISHRIDIQIILVILGSNLSTIRAKMVNHMEITTNNLLISKTMDGNLMVNNKIILAMEDNKTILILE